MTPRDGGPAAIMICSHCGSAFEPKSWQVTGRDRRCVPCKRRQQNDANRADPEKMRAASSKRYAANPDYWRNYAAQRRADPNYLAKRAARRKVATEIEAGRLQRSACAECGNVKADAHHDDYAKPLEVVWLCHAHHMARHAMLAAREAQP